MCAAGGICQRTATPAVDAADDSALDAPSVDPAWACLGSGEQLPAETDLHVFARYRSFAGVPLAGLTVTGCSLLSLDCSPPVAGTPKETGGDGLFEIVSRSSVLGGFRGTLETFASDAGGQLLPSVLFVQAGVTNTQSLEPAGVDRPRHPTDLLSAADLQAIADASDPKVAINPDASHIVFTALDCLQDVVVGATVSSDYVNTDTRLVYFDESGKPSKDGRTTTASGRGAFLNVPASNVTISLVVSGEKVVTQSVPARKGAVSYTFLGPAQ